MHTPSSLAAGAQKPIMSDVVAGCPRWMAMKFKTMEKTPREILAVSAYHPYNDMDEILTEEFYDKYDDFLSEHTSGNLTTIIGCDANVALGPMRSKEERAIVGKYGTGKEEANDTCTDRFKAMLHLHKLRAATTDFIHNRYDTWHSEGLRVTKQLDYFMVSNQIMDRKSTYDAKRTGNGIESDHAAISLKFKLNQTTERLKPKAKTNPAN